jgi:D-lactate dehydrogenase (cytochrome)
MRNQRARPVPARFLQLRHFGASAQHAKENQSFKSQLYESTQQRLKRERAEQERFAQYQQTQSPAGRSAALVFGTQRPNYSHLGFLANDVL